MSLSPRDELYITLPSNVPGSQRNTPADYETTLPTQLVLNGDWEVALLECHYFHDWRNLSGCDLGFFVRPQKTQSDQLQSDQPLDGVDGHWFDENDMIDDEVKSESIVIKPQPLTNAPSTKEAAKPIDVDEPSSSDSTQEKPYEVITQEEKTRIAKESDAGKSLTNEISDDVSSTSRKSTQQEYEDQSEKAKEAEEKRIKFKIREFATLASKLQKSSPRDFGTLGHIVWLDASNYDGVKGLCETICLQFKEKFLADTILQYQIVNGKVKFFCPTALVWMVSSTPYLFQRLGLPPMERIVDGRTLYILGHNQKAPLRAYLDDVHSIFVYSDIIDYQIVGNSKAMLLGVFPTKGVHGEQQSWQFNPLQYISVKMRAVQSIQLKLWTPTGELVPFQSGDTLCRLHFKRKLV